MAENKRQHFVPRFYLRNFADPNGGSIGVYNIASERIIRQAKLKTQAYRDYFYGKDGVTERWMGGIEGPASRVISAILKTGRPPKRGEREHHALIFFLVLQLGRTVRAAEEANARTDLVAKALLRQQLQDPDLIKALDRVKIGHEEPVIGAIEQMIVGAPAFFDLAFKLIDNLSPVAFVTSDHPVARHNQLLETAVDLSVVGAGASGLQLFLPLSPRYGLLFYDDYAYAVGGRSSSVVRVSSADYARQLNALQWCEARDNLYFSGSTHDEELRAAAQANAGNRLVAFDWVDGTVVSATETQKRMRFAYRSPTRPLRLDVPFMRLRGPRPDCAGWDEVPMRFPEWIALLEELGEDLREGRISDAEYVRWTSRIPALSKRERRVR